MNNGRPPYGDPSQWGQQPAAGQENPAQYAPGQSAYGQYAQQQGSYQQPSAGAYQPPYQQSYGQHAGGQHAGQSQPWQPQTYQPQAHQAQESYQQQSWQPYGQQQSYPQDGYPQNGYPQSGYSTGSYPQGTYSQGVQQPYQQGYSQQPMYQQSMQNGQPLQQGYPQQAPSQPTGQYFPAQGYSGYVTQPAAEDKGMPISEEVIVKVALFGVLPVLFLLAVLLKQPVLCWIFLAGAAATVAAMWLRDMVDSNLRLISSMICGVLAVVALVVAINGPGRQQQQQEQQGGVPGPGAAQNPGSSMDMSWEYTPVPSATPTATPDPYAESGAAAEQLQSFFYFWHVNNDESMLALTAPSWRNQQADPLKALFTIRANRTPADDCQIIEFSGSESDTVRTARVRVTVSKNITGRDPDLYSFNVVMLKEDGTWYVDPQSLVSNEKVTTTQAAYNTMPTQPAPVTGLPDMIMYYNPDGGTYYHADPNCSEVASKYRPLKGQFLFSQVNEALYKDLRNCTWCSTPHRTQ